MTALEQIQRMIEAAIVEHDRLDGDMGPLTLSIGIAEVLVRDYGDELPQLMVAVLLDRAYEKGWEYGRTYLRRDVVNAARGVFGGRLRYSDDSSWESELLAALDPRIPSSTRTTDHD